MGVWWHLKWYSKTTHLRSCQVTPKCITTYVLYEASIKQGPIVWNIVGVHPVCCAWISFMDGHLLHKCSDQVSGIPNPVWTCFFPPPPPPRSQRHRLMLGKWNCLPGVKSVDSCRVPLPAVKYAHPPTPTNGPSLLE